MEKQMVNHNDPQTVSPDLYTSYQRVSIFTLAVNTGNNNLQADGVRM